MGFSLSAMAKSLPFAHLAGVGARARRAEDAPVNDEDGNEPPAERDREDGAQANARAEDNGDDRERDDDSDGDGPQMDDDGDGDKDGPDRDSKRSRKARRARAQDEDDDEEMHGKSEAACARRREQARCAAIFASQAAARNPVLAANLAFTTRLSRSAAVAMLESTPAPVQPGVERAARNPRVGPGGTPEVNSRQAIAASWDRAFANVTPRAR